MNTFWALNALEVDGLMLAQQAQLKYELLETVERRCEQSCNSMFQNIPH